MKDCYYTDDFWRVLHRVLRGRGGQGYERHRIPASPLEMAERRIERQKRDAKEEEDAEAFAVHAMAEYDRLKQRLDACMVRAGEQEQQRAVQQQLLDAAIAGGAGGSVMTS